MSTVRTRAPRWVGELLGGKRVMRWLRKHHPEVIETFLTDLRAWVKAMLDDSAELERTRRDLERRRKGRPGVYSTLGYLLADGRKIKRQAAHMAGQRLAERVSGGRLAGGSHGGRQEALFADVLAERRARESGQTAARRKH